MSGDGRWPDFLLIGATKAGTTSLHDWLSRHPQVFVHPWKEMRFFLYAGRWDRGIDWYQAQFAGQPGKVVGEASNGYGRQAEHPGTAKRIAAHLPDVRLVYVVREPMARMASHYRHRIATGKEWRDAEAAIRADPGYVQTGLYGAELARWRDVFPAEQILVLQSEQVFDDPAPHLARLARHLGVDPAPDLPFAARNVSKDRPAVPRGLSRLAASAGAGRLTRAAMRRIERLPPGIVRHIGGGAGRVPFSLPADLRAELVDRYRADRRLLRQLAGPGIGMWCIEDEG